MLARIGVGCVVAAAIGMFCSPQAAQAAGPDVVLSGIPSVTSYDAVGGIRGYAIGSNTCNIGDQNMEWNNNGSPGLAMNAYRLHDGRLMQIGLSNVKTSCCVSNTSGCGVTCQSGGTGLRVGCMDTYSSSWNGQQGRLAPRSVVNPYSGSFGSFPALSGNTIFRRLQVVEADMNLANHPGAQFFVEGVYVGTSDAQSGNWLNNASYRPITFNASYQMGLTGSFHATFPAIYAWRHHGNGLNNPDNSVDIRHVDIPGEGRFVVAAKARDNGDGTWRYDYAIFNLNSHRSGASLSVPVPAGVNVTAIGFHSPPYHSDEVYDNSHWTFMRNSGGVTWTSPKSFSEDPNTNALRWGTMYNFWFTASRPPMQGQATLGLFRPGTPSELSFDIIIPEPILCVADIAPPGGDGAVNVNDLLAVINAWGPCANPQSCPADIAPPGGDGAVNVNDLLAVINAWGPCQ
jgi:hypothetical protein